MKSFFTTIMIIIIISACNRINDQLESEFKNPPLKYRMNQNIHNIPMDPAVQDTFIHHYLGNGYGGFTINVPYEHYLTDEGMKATLEFSEKANNAGMELWLYDERGYPSGNAGDLVIKQNPEWESMGLYFKDTIVKKGKIKFILPPGKPELITAYRLEEDEINYDNTIDLMNLADDSVLNWNAPNGTWKIFAFTKYRLYENFQASAKSGGKVGANYPSLMIPEVTETFIDITHEKYVEYFGEDLGKYFTSTFTDEPSLMAVPYPWKSWTVIPWHNILSEEIQKRYGYRPEEKLVELFTDQGPNGQKLRYQYFHTVGDLIANNYFRPIKEWCEEHNLKSGGHLLLEETMMAHVPLYGNIMQCFRELHAPGIDILSCFPENMPVHSPKLASSAAELTGNELVMSEPCPVADRNQLGGKETPAESVRGHLNMLLQGGVTDFNNYLRLSNSDTEEKKEFNIYVGRIARLLKGSISKADIAIVYPIESLWTAYTPEPIKVAGWDSVGGGAEKAIRIEQSFRNVSRFMFNNRWEYNYIDAQAIIDSEVQNDKLVHGNLKWKILVLPSVSTLPSLAWDKIEDFIQAGGKVIALELLPENTEELFPDPDLKLRFKKLFSEKGNAVFMEKLNSPALEEQLQSFTEKAVALDNESLPLRIAHKTIAGRDVFFLINNSDKPLDCKVKFNTDQKLREWDPAAGSVNKISHSIDLSLKPYHGKVYR